MINVCPELEKRLDSAWYRLQNAIRVNLDQRVSQIDMDELTVEKIEALADSTESALKQKLIIGRMRIQRELNRDDSQLAAERYINQQYPELKSA